MPYGNKEDPRAYDHKKYGSTAKGRSEEQLAKYKKDFTTPRSKALKGKKRSYDEAKERHNDNYGDTMLAK